MNIMIDIESLGVKPGCSILSIGAVEFDEERNYREFYVEIDRASCRAAGLVEDEDTLKWWITQSEEARRVLEPATSINITAALKEFIQFVYESGPKPLIWGNGATFDPPIIETAIEKILGRKAPWAFYNVRCFRTVKSLFRDIEAPHNPGAHNALEDARSQVKHAIAIAHAYDFAFT